MVFFWGGGNRHNLTYYPAVAATCTTDGNVEYWYCEDCGKYFADESATEELDSVIIEATGHTYVTDYVDEDDGFCYLETYCTVCGDVTSSEVMGPAF